MPLFRGVTVTVHTPFSLDGLPETALPAGAKPSETAEEESKCASVLIPAHVQSLFWLSYSAEHLTEDIFYVFKLFINRKHVVTWCCDEDQQWKGKIQFALFRKGDGSALVGGAGMEKRVLQFGHVCPGNDDNRCVEVKVHRAGTKTRIPRQVGSNQNISVGNGVHLLEAGLTKRGHPRKFYRFNLVDPTDDPYATFRFYYRTQDEIGSLNRRMGQAGICQAPPASNADCPAEPVSKVKLIRIKENGVSRLPQTIQRSKSDKLSHVVPSHTCIPPTPQNVPDSILRREGETNLRRLSIPPSTILRPLLDYGPLPVSPAKKPAPISDGSRERRGGRQKENGIGMFRSFLHGLRKTDEGNTVTPGLENGTAKETK